MGRLIQSITDHYSQLLIGIIEYCIKNMFTDVNNGMKYVVLCAGKGPGVMLPEAFDIIKKLSDNVMLPISCIIISFILTYELISMVIDKNNMHEVDSALLARYLFKAAASVFLLSKSYEITMAIFDVGAYLVTEAGKVIVGNINLSVEDALVDTYVNSLSTASVTDLYGAAGGLMLCLFSFKIMTVLIVVISYGRLVEMFLMVSVSPVAFATFGNKEWGQIGVNYIKAIVALAFQGFLIMVLVAVYVALLEGVTHTSNIPGSVFNLVILTFLFCFGLFKTSTLSKQIFTVR